ncbi:DNA internalization-related competence protein ComEC/Rec2 [Deinococcus piscis]|uniref:DNA internalization-related competence protein ComEC/Rec2 n=2 Tax=Deinococcus piscis TaxID=394230 RepID=A0ABQ3K1Y2_9DEIO|nr:DNA internalization-related competence protein ComEC/Rec2 [Deinococcus piscis]
MGAAEPDTVAPSPAPQLGGPVFLLLGVLGALLPALGYPWDWALWPLLLGLAAWERRPWAVAGAVLAGALAFASLHTVQARPDPLRPWLGAQVTLRGDWDGQFLTLHDPPARVALSPRPAERRGSIAVHGRLLPPRTRTVPGGFDQAAWLRSQGGLLTLAPTAVLVGAEVGAAQPSASVKGTVQGWFESGWQGLSPRAEALLRGAELGDRSDLNEMELSPGVTVRDAFQRSGLTHLLALSGQHVTLLVGALTLLLTRLPLPVWARYAVPVLFLLAYLGMVVNTSPSVVRAGLTGLLGLAALWLGRGRLDAASLVALVAAGLLICYPLWVITPGFQLSFLAVGGLLLLPRVLARLPAAWTRPGPPLWLTGSVAVTLLAQAATLPLIAGSFGGVPLSSLPANLLAGPLMALLIPLGFLAGLLGPLGAALKWPLELLSAALLWLAETFGRWPLLPWGAVGPAGYLAYGLAALAGVLWLTGRVRAPAALGTLLACMLLTALPPRLSPPRQLAFLDVGQGDATLIQTPELRALIDGGGTPRGDYDLSRTTVPALHSLGVHALDVVVATHSDSDHIEGLSGVLRAMPVGELWIGQLDPENAALAELLSVAEERGVPVRQVRRGDYVQAGGLRLDVLWPQGNFWSTEPNENSVALRLTATGRAGQTFRAALLGDLPAPLEHSLGLGRVDLLKSPHHGSRHSTSAALLQETGAREAVVSVGFNTFGHPSREVRERLDAAGTRIWRTDTQGTVLWPLPK